MRLKINKLLSNREPVKFEVGCGDHSFKLQQNTYTVGIDISENKYKEIII